MTYAHLQKAFKAQPGFNLWLRLLGAKPEDEVMGAGMLTIEVLDALFRYQLVPRTWVLGVDAFDFVHAWADTLGGDLRGQIVCVINGRYLMLGNFIAVDFGCDAAPINQALLQAGVIVRPVAGYGMPTFLRVSIGTEGENARFLEALEQILRG